MSANIRDVAKAAGVSASTVSRSFSLDGSVSDATRQRIAAEAKRLNYHPNTAAQRLVTGRSGNLGLIVPDLLNPFFADVAKGMQARAREARNAVFISDTGENVRLELDAVRSLSNQVDGLILCSPRMSDDELLELRALGPVVLLERRAPGMTSVSADLASGIGQAVANLQALGHVRVAYVPGPRGSWSEAEHWRGLTAIVEETGLDLVILGNVRAYFEGGFAAGDVLLASGATAVIAYNDIVALGLLSRLAVRGVRVPDEMSVVGYDDIATSLMASPPLTTVAVPKAEAARAAVDLLLEMIEQPDREVVECVLPTHLLVRGTTAVPSSREIAASSGQRPPESRAALTG